VYLGFYPEGARNQEFLFSHELWAMSYEPLDSKIILSGGQECPPSFVPPQLDVPKWNFKFSNV
jgi:hypothetical protein